MTSRKRSSGLSEIGIGLALAGVVALAVNPVYSAVAIPVGLTFILIG